MPERSLAEQLEDAQKLKGRRVTLPLGKGILVRGVIEGASIAYGNIRYAVKPLSVDGKGWFEAGKMHIEEMTPPPAAISQIDLENVIIEPSRPKKTSDK